ncbi:MAG TPA: hypothetical protein ENG45_01540 [Candidatus Aenigmarchaeota archaeon]|nr:hypothetical protein [Candidatus Aenigmarchaeota archaeon]
MKKGIIFTMDSVLALGMLLVLALFVASFGLMTSRSEREYQQLNFLAKDAIQLLSTMEVWEAKEKPTINNLISKGVIKNEDMNKTLLDLIGTLWEMKNYSLAENVTREVLENLIDDSCFKLTIGEEKIYSSCEEDGWSIAIATRIESGYELGKPPSGYIARAWATKVKKNTTEIIPFFPEGSGWKVIAGNGGPLEITKEFYIPEDYELLKAVLHFSFHVGNIHTEQAMFQKVNVNGENIRQEVLDNILYSQCEAIGSEITCAVYSVVEITDLLQPGMNEIYIEMGAPQTYHTHSHPGMRIVLTYSVIQEMLSGNRTFRKRVYFDDVVGRTGAWSTLSFYLPENATNYDAILSLKLRDIEDSAFFGTNTSDVMVFVNSENPVYTDGNEAHPTYPYFYCYSINWKNYYCYRTLSEPRDINITLNITPYLQPGTNIVSVYVNCYGDYHWGDDKAEIYAEEVENPLGSSYVEVYYELPSPKFQYGEVDLTKEIEFGGNESNPKLFQFNLTQAESRVIESFTHIAQGFSSMLEINITHDNEPWRTAFISPAPRAIPESAYLQPSVWKAGDNYINLRDFQPGGSTSPTNYILPWSSFEYTYIVKGIVGYGDVFNTSEEAVNDAIQRLVNELGSNVDATDIVIENKSVQGIRWLWGPSLFNLMVWKP